ncbi:MAG: hypothetical protein ACYDG6_01985 [Thermincolia bacterium]
MEIIFIALSRLDVLTLIRSKSTHRDFEISWLIVKYIGNSQAGGFKLIEFKNLEFVITCNFGGEPIRQRPWGDY